jgi:phospholipid N-methyltransferase
LLFKYSDKPGLKLEIKRALKAIGRPDKQGRIILKSTHDIELFKSIGSKISDKWDKERVTGQIKNLERLQKIGLTSDYMLRMALRELSELSAGSGESEEEKQAREMKEIERSFIGKKIDGFFPTPPMLIEKMFSMAKVFEHETILEPSAGLGHIAEAIRLKYPENELDVVEVNRSLFEALEKNKFQAFNMDFLTVKEVSYDVIFMNPPFEKHQDIDHVLHAYSLLKKGGRLVAIMAGNKKNSSQSKVNEFIDFVNDHGYMVENEKGAFKSAFRSTNVHTVTVYLEKPTD